MVSFVPQILIPPLVALAFLRRLPRGWVMALAPSTYLADIDYLVPESWAHRLGLEHVHRLATHTLVLPAAILLGLALAWNRKRPTHADGAPKGFWAYALTPGWPLGLTLLCYYLAAHDLMDVFTGGVALVWPFSNLTVYYDFTIDVNLETHQVIPTAEPGAMPAPGGLDPDYHWLTDEHSAMLAPVVAVLLGLGVHRLWRSRRANVGAADGAAEPSGSQGPSKKAK